MKICSFLLWLGVGATLLLRAEGQQTVVAASTLQLDEVLHLALERSPELHAAEAAIRASEHRIAPAHTLPDPTVTAGWAGKLAPMVTMPGDASSYRGVSISEQFPYPGKLRLQTALAERDRDTARTECEAVRRKIVLDATLAYIEYAYLTRALLVTEENRDLLRKLAEIAEAQYRVGKASQQDVARAQLEISILAEKLVLLEEQRSEAQTTLNALLLQDPGTRLGDPTPLELHELKFDESALFQLAVVGDSSLQRALAVMARNRAALALAERQKRPDIGVSYMYQQRTDQPDMHGVSISVTVPVFHKQRQQQAVAEAAENLHGSQSMQESQQNTLRAELHKQYLTATTSARLLTLYTQGIVPQASFSLESGMSAYQNGRLDFSALLSSFSAVLNYETDSYRKLADYNEAIARIESMTGESVTAVAVANGKGALASWKN